MKHLFWGLLFSVLLFACSEEEIDSARAQLLDEDRTITVVFDNIPDGQEGNPVYVFTLNNSDEVYSVEEAVATEDTVLVTTPPPGNASFSIVAYIPTVDDWTLQDEFVDGFYSTIKGATDRNGRYVTSTWTEADDLEDSGEAGAEQTLTVELSIDGETEPASNEYAQGSILELAADETNNTNSAITSVEFLLDGSVIETVNETPYSINFNTVDVSAGEHVLSVSITNADEDVATDEIEILITVTSNSAPSVEIGGLNNNDEIERQEIITIQSNASDDDGDLASVSFIIDGTTVATEEENPAGASYDWDTFDNAIGSLVIEVRATDSNGAERSDFVNVTLVDPDNYFPRVTSLSSSLGNSFSETTTSVTLDASASDPDGDAIGNVTFSYSINDGGFTQITIDTESPFSVDWDPSALIAADDVVVIRAQVYNDDLTTDATISTEEITITITE